MNILKARAKRRDNGEWVVGYPCDFKGRLTIRLLIPPNPFYENLYADPSTLGYETGKRDKHGREIYGGMKVWVTGQLKYQEPQKIKAKVVWGDWMLSWRVVRDDGEHMALGDISSSNLEIIDEKEEAK